MSPEREIRKISAYTSFPKVQQNSCRVWGHKRELSRIDGVGGVPQIERAIFLMDIDSYIDSIYRWRIFESVADAHTR
jgi:hypothetical protein